MGASLNLSASYHGWVCSNCKQLFDCMWRPIEYRKAWIPPSNYIWPEDKPTFRFCPSCGEPIEKEPDYADEIRT